jgi:hypothetical protein
VRGRTGYGLRAGCCVPWLPQHGTIYHLVTGVALLIKRQQVSSDAGLSITQLAYVTNTTFNHYTRSLKTLSPLFKGVFCINPTL